MFRWLLLLLVFAGSSARAAIDPYEFDSEAQRDRYRHFIEKMRCPKCQNQNLSGSDAPIATDLRRELHRLLQEGRSDQEIVDFMVARYGAYILYDPPFDNRTALLWLAPLVFFGTGVCVLLLIVRRRRAPAEPVALNAAERARVEQLLREPDGTTDQRSGEDKAL
jgi:cytochrome c-type biogenesis protein CcmH